MNPIHHYTYWALVANGTPFAITVVLVVLSAFMLLFASSGGGWVCGLLSMFFALLITIPILTMKWHHHERRQAVRIEVAINGQHAWLDAQRLPNGTYWPQQARLTP